ncbi:hypothetical protein ACHAWF_012644 [Thalassiosira exigua]
MDVISKVMSRIINGRLFNILDAHGTKFQFGGTPGVGCREGVFTLKTLLHIRRSHGLSTHVVFVDLVKAYDTANHELLIQVMEKFGVPSKIRSVVERHYTNLKVVFKLGDLSAEISQGVGVRQGDNMAPVLFLFLMATFSELLEKAYDEAGIIRVQVCRESDETFRKGQLFRHNVKKCSKSATTVLATIDNVIYVDDEGLPFVSRAQSEKGLPIAQQIMSYLGLEMHIGRRLTVTDADGVDQEVIKASKTECVFFPAPGYFKQRAIESGASEEEILLLSNTAESQAECPASSKLEDKLYDECNETDDIQVTGGFVSYCKHFKYLGSWLSYNLRDD